MVTWPGCVSSSIGCAARKAGDMAWWWRTPMWSGGLGPARTTTREALLWRARGGPLHREAWWRLRKE
jgi:hypothetical protein